MSITVYHGTSEALLPKILKTGLQPARRRKNHDESGDYVYVDTSDLTARAWGRYANAFQVAVLEIEVEEGSLAPDTKTLSKTSYKTATRIPASCIKSWDIYHMDARTGDMVYIRSEENPRGQRAAA